MELPNQDDNENEIEELETQVEAETPSAKALRNSLVLQMIIGHLSRFSLLQYRRINKLWRELCTELLSKSRDEDEDALRIKFRYCEATGAYIKDFDGILRGEIKTLESFTEFLRLNSSPLDLDLDLNETARSSSSSTFPCPNFEFKHLDLSRPEIQEFFRIQGPKIKGLRLDFDDRETTAVTTESFTDLLMKKAKNVECLTVSEIPFYWHSANLNRRQILNININLNAENPSSIFCLGKLRCLRFSQHTLNKPTYFVLMKEIALASPALITVFVLGSPWADEMDFDYFTSVSKSHLITRVELCLSARNVEVLTKFVQAQCQPRLKVLSLSLEFVDSRSALIAGRSISYENFVPFATALLESVKESLEHFTMPQGKRIAHFLREGGIPVLKNVKFVDLYCEEERGRSGWRIPAKKFKKKFPSVRKLGLCGHAGGGGLLTFRPLEEAPVPIPVVAEKDKMPQITNLCLRGKFTREFWNSIPLVFCNLVELRIRNKNLIPILPLVWSYTSLRLKVLALEISISSSLSQSTKGVADEWCPAPIFPGLDAAFTGFSEDACFQLLSMYPVILEEEIVQDFRINASVLDFKFLEELRITFDVFDKDELPENVLTVVSGAYAFQRIKLEQNCKVHIETKLHPPHDRNVTNLISKKQRAEKNLKPLLPYAKLNFTIGKL